MAVEGAEEVAEFRQQRGEVTAGRHQGGERAEQEPHREQRRRRQHRRFEISSDLSPLTIDFALYVWWVNCNHSILAMLLEAISV